MTTELIEPKPALRPSVIQKQYRNGLGLNQLAILYETDEETLKPIIEGITPKQRPQQDEDLEEKKPRMTEAEKQERRDAIIELAKSGLEVVTIAERFGITDSHVFKILRDAGMRRGKPRKTLDYDDLALEVKRLMDETKTNHEICKELGFSYATLQKIKGQYGLKLSKHQGGKNAQRKQQEKREARGAKVKRQKVPNLIYPLEANEEPTMPDVTTASLESAVTAFKEEEVSEVIGKLDEQQKRMERIEKRVLNRDKGVWAEYLTARSEEIENVTHNVEVLVENGKLIERTTIAYTLKRELGR